MKTFKLLSLLFCLSVFSFNQSNAQVDVTVNPLTLLFGGFNGSADFVLSENLSIEAQIGLAFGKSDIGLNDDESKYFGLPVTVFGKYYFSPDDGADKFYADAFLKFVTRSYTIEGDNTFNYADYSNTRFGLGFGVGYKIVSDGGFVFDIGFGAGKAFVDKTKFDADGEEVGSIDLPNLMLTGKLAVGYRFGGK